MLKEIFTAQRIFPLLLIALNLGAAVMSFIHRDFRKGTYWLAAAVLNITVTF